MSAPGFLRLILNLPTSEESRKKISEFGNKFAFLLYQLETENFKYF
jgi:hypothetical protein